MFIIFKYSFIVKIKSDKVKNKVSEFFFGSAWIYIHLIRDIKSALSFYFIFPEKY